MFSRSLFLSLALLTGPQAWASPESTQLALALKQLDGVKTSLERARSSASVSIPYNRAIHI
ncbi:hypothetical protein DTV46_09050 [Salmonella enterica subsp. salamae]|nr:hypothetical protein [Salmonella enterica subsp. salamae]